jgi:hypothetical protein
LVNPGSTLGAWAKIFRSKGGHKTQLQQQSHLLLKVKAKYSFSPAVISSAIKKQLAVLASSPPHSAVPEFIVFSTAKNT